MRSSGMSEPESGCVSVRVSIREDSICWQKGVSAAEETGFEEIIPKY